MSSRYYCTLWIFRKCNGNDKHAEYDYEDGTQPASEYCILSYEYVRSYRSTWQNTNRVWCSTLTADNASACHAPFV